MKTSQIVKLWSKPPTGMDSFNVTLTSRASAENICICCHSCQLWWWTHPTQLPSAVPNVLASFGSLFWFYNPQPYCFGSLPPLSCIKWLRPRLQTNANVALHVIFRVCQYVWFYSCFRRELQNIYAQFPFRISRTQIEIVRVRRIYNRNNYRIFKRVMKGAWVEYAGGGNYV